ncbi:hypothetical protein BC827DRAFT_516549 [Russula dissimulans]|nr:hypothetical protein BC827DRAFT_516549 [Russula dissimulans]
MGVGLAERGAVLHSILTFIFPVTPLIPSSIGKTMELVSVAQKYQMDSVLGHIRGAVPSLNTTRYPLVQTPRAPRLLSRTEVRASPRGITGRANYAELPDDYRGFDRKARVLCPVLLSVNSGSITKFTITSGPFWRRTLRSRCLGCLVDAER